MARGIAGWYRKTNKRHLVLKICVPISVTLNVIKVFVICMDLASWWSVLLQESRADADITTFAAPRDIPNRDVRHALGSIIIILVIQVPTSILHMAYFVFFWHRKGKTYRRSAILAALGTLAIILAGIVLGLSQTAAGKPIDIDKTLQLYPKLSAQQVQEEYDSFMHSLLMTAQFVLAASTIDSLVQDIIIAFWIWLLPSYWRIPDQYEPVVVNKTGKRHRLEGVSYSYLPEVEDRADIPGDSLAALFREHEKIRILERAKPVDKINENQGTDVVDPILAPGTASRSSSGPRFNPAVYYWARKYNSHGLKYFLWFAGILELALFALKVSAFSLSWANNLWLRWSSILGLCSASIIVVLLVTLAFSIRRRTPLDCKLFGVVRLDVLLYSTFLLEWLLSEICYIDYLVLQNTSEYEQFAEALRVEDARRYETLKTVVNIYVVALVFSPVLVVWAIYLVIQITKGNKLKYHFVI
ncbi:uncharacterized protein F4812DRAFT_427627 [Daldinia caldariorum]|uniref:uncharacterized protein n=1 Tax=Daldinia caldariorum TaxID=326644 RepID=UPI002008C14D|nr:uncharacterized protein F4812DRAFT_427627 [Daldinia caldariorum]KAI1467802.1 hypothetical protein F4812DRAFT_427627 [Daldinia caldariorum]